MDIPINSVKLTFNKGEETYLIEYRDLRTSGTKEKTIKFPDGFDTEQLFGRNDRSAFERKTTKEGKPYYIEVAGIFPSSLGSKLEELTQKAIGEIKEKLASYIAK